jgi:hypothetical protein
MDKRGILSLSYPVKYEELEPERRGGGIESAML